MKKDSISTLKRDAIIFGKLLTEFTKKTSSYAIAKNLFEKQIKNDYDLRKKESFMRKWFEKWRKLGVISSEVVNGVTYYSVNLDKIRWGEAILKLKCRGKVENINLGFSLALKIENSWVIVTLS